MTEASITYFRSIDINYAVSYQTQCISNLLYITGLEKFVIRGYSKEVTKVGDLATMRWHLFRKHSLEASKLPPTQSALKFRIFRCHYVALVLKKCCVTMQCLPDPTGYGWEVEGDKLVPIMTDDLPAHVGLVELSMCSFKGSCVKQIDVHVIKTG